MYRKTNYNYTTCVIYTQARITIELNLIQNQVPIDDSFDAQRRQAPLAIFQFKHTSCWWKFFPKFLSIPAANIHPHESTRWWFPIYLHTGTKWFIVPSDRLIVTNSQKAASNSSSRNNKHPIIRRAIRFVATVFETSRVISKLSAVRAKCIYAARGKCVRESTFPETVRGSWLS